MRKQVSSNGSESVGTLARGLDVLELFAKVSPELSQKEISEGLGLPMPTVHRLTKALGERGYLVRDARSRRFRLGMGIARLLPALLSGLGLPQMAREHLRALVEESGETANLAILDGGEVVYLVSEAGTRLLTSHATVGMRLPAHCNALGKCLLAQLDDEVARRAVGPEPYRALTPRTLTTWRDLHAQLRNIRESGVSVSREELEVGLDSIAVPVPWAEGRGPAAINVSLPTSRATPEVSERLIDGLRRAAAAISATADVATLPAKSGT